MEVVRDEQQQVVDLMYRRVNDAFERLTGLNKVIGKTALEVRPNYDTSRFKLYRDIMATGEASQTEFYEADLHRWFRSYESRVGGPDSPLLATIFDDITEHKQGEEALRESRLLLENELEDIKQLQHISNLIVDEEGNIQDLYHAILRSIMDMMHADFASLQLLLPETNQLQLLASENFHPDSAKFWKYVDAASTSTCGLALAKGERIFIEDIEHLPFKMDKGDYDAYTLSGIVSVQSTPLITRSGKQAGMMSTHWRTPHKPSERELALYDIVARQVADLIERKKTEEAVRKSDEQLKTVLKGISEAFYALDRNWCFLFASLSALKMWDKTQEEVLGRHFLECFPEAAGTAPYEAHRRVMMSGAAERFETISPVLNRRIEVEIAPTQQCGLSVAFRDIEDRRRAEEVLQQSEAKLKKFNAALEQQVKQRTEELTELNRRQKELEEWQRQQVFRVILDTQEEERKRIAENLHNSIGQILYGTKLSLGQVLKADIAEDHKQHIRMADKLLSDAIAESRRLSHELMPVILEDFGLKVALEDICRQLSGQTRFKHRSKGLTNRLDKYIEVAVYRIVQELTMNIVKHAKATEALVAVEVQRAQLLVLVQDNGKGFNAESAKTPGIGLKTIQNKVSLLNGNIDIESKPDLGTVININIPIKTD
jgi:signal transduction histidine kinase